MGVSFGLERVSHLLRNGCLICSGIRTSPQSVGSPSSGFHLNALSSGLALNVDLDTTLTVVAGNIYRLFARDLPRYEAATPDRLYRHFIHAPGRVTVSSDEVVVALGVKTYTPVLLEAGYRDRQVVIPWWNGRRLQFSFPPR
jgi:hypothetical protein